MSEPIDSKPPTPDVPHTGYVNNTGNISLPHNPPIIRVDREPLQRPDESVVRQEPLGKIINPRTR